MYNTTTINTTTTTTSTVNKMHKSTAAATTTATTTATSAHTRLWLLAFQLLALSCALPSQRGGIGVVALPITSKPIEGTAENLAWQAWLMLPPEQKQLEKSRKVTPKSIFSLPFRDCPPGHQLFQSRCIPTVNINQSELLTQQLLGLIVGSEGAAGTDNAYEFDYEDEELSVGDGEPVLLYDSAQRFNGDGVDAADDGNAGGSSAATNFDESSGAGGSSAQQPPHNDEPLKFNLFQQKFPTSDYETDGGSAIEGSGGARPPPLPESMSSALFNATQFLDAVQGFLHRNAATNGSVNAPTTNANSTNNNNTSYYYGSNYTHSGNNTSASNNNTNTNSTGYADQQASSSNNMIATLATVAAPPTFAFSDIDAIVLSAAASPSAAPTVAANAFSPSAPASVMHTNLEPQRVSLFKDDSAVQLVTTVIDRRQQSVAPAQALISTGALSAAQPDNIGQLLRDDALLPLAQPDAPNASAATSERIDAPAALALAGGAWAGTTMPTPPLLLLSAQAESSSNIDYEVTEPTTTTTRTMANAAALVEKDERPRSVTQRNASVDAADTEAQEVGFTTTVEPEGTTNFQIDETTVIESVERSATQRAELLEEILQAQAKQQLSESEQERRRVLKKSKVEPVDETTINAHTAATATTTTTTPATQTLTTSTMNAKIATATTTPKAIETTTTTATTTTTTATATATATPLPSALTTIAAAAASADRFGSNMTAAAATDNQVVVSVGVDVGVAVSDVPRSGSNLVNAHRNTSDTNDQHNNKSNSTASKNNNNSVNDFSNNKDVDSKKSPKTSEINIEQELRMINELVKGKRQLAALKMPTTSTDTTSAAAMPVITTTTAAVTSTSSAAAATTTTTERATEKTESRRSVATEAEMQDAAAVDGSSSIIKTITATSGSRSSATPAVAAKISATKTKTNQEIVPNAAIMESEGDGVVIGAATTTTAAATATKTATTTTIDAAASSTTPSTTAATAPSPTLWSRIMPILGFGSAVEEAASDTTTMSTTTATATTTAASVDASASVTQPQPSQPHPALSSSISISTSGNDPTNRSNRNSKIIRINNLSDNVVAIADADADVDAPPIVATATPATSASAQTQTAATVAVATDEQLEVPASTDAFWWLPAGWRLDRQVNDEQQLLLRFWSAFPESQLKAKVRA